MPGASSCPDPRDLERLVLGQLPSQEQDALEEHVGRCARCGQAISRLQAEDPLIEAMRVRADAIAASERVLVEGLIGQLKALAVPPRRSAPGQSARETPAALLAVETPPAADGQPAPGGTRQRYAFLAPAQAADEIGGLDGYRVLGVLGSGGMGVVFRAEDPPLKRVVALKVLLDTRCAEPRYLARFRGEAESAARLQHPNIVQVFKIGEHEGRPYLVLEYVAGGDLAEHLAGRPQPPRASAELLATLAGAVHHAHQMGVVHRDLKPANILLQSAGFGTPKITDFGLAKRLDEEGLTQTGDLLGTPSYMAPELTRGHGPGADSGPAADVYALGAILYEALTGRPPFQAPTVLETLEQVRTQEPVPPRRLQPGVPRYLETICLKCLHKEPQRRYRSAEALAEDLECWLRGEPIQARRVSVPGRAWRWCRRNPRPALMTAAVALVAMVGATVGAMYYEARARAIQESRSLRELQGIAWLDLARQCVRLPRQGRRLETQKILDRVAASRKEIVPGPLLDQLDLQARSLYAASLGVPDVAEVATYNRLPRHFSQTWPVALHPDGEAMVIGTDQGPVYWARGQEPRATFARKLQELDPRAARPRLWYSPDGKRLAFAPPAGGLQLWDGAVTGFKELQPLGTSPVLAVGFDPQSKTLWACCRDGRVRSWSLPEGKEGVTSELRRGADPEFQAAAFNAEANRVAIGDAKGSVRLYEVNGKAQKELPRATMEVQTLAWSPDGHLVAVGSKGGIVQIFRVNVGEPELAHRWVLSNIGVESLVFHPSGGWLLAGMRGGAAKMWDTATGEQVLTAPTVPGGFARDGRRFAGGDWDNAGFYDLLLPRAVQTFVGHRAAVDRIAWSRDSRHLVSLDAQFQVRIWTVGQVTAVDVFAAPPSDGFWALQAAVALSDDGRLVAYACGGDEEARALIREVDKHAFLTDSPWKLPGGYEQLTWADGRFLLVREEDETREDKTGDDKTKKRTVRSVAYELVAGKEPRRLGVVRASEAGDFRRFLRHGLTPDGRYYWWVGPRDPEEKRRVEVREVATGKQIRTVPRPGSDEPVAILSADGQRLWVSEGGSEATAYDLTGAQGSVRISRQPWAASADLRWFADDSGFLTEGRFPSLSLRRGEEQPAWLEFANNDLSLTREAMAFSPDGRYLVWGSVSGTITLADLNELSKEVEVFEAKLRAK
jgi:eukaryotic-like serine/threonine-protein kinase